MATGAPDREGPIGRVRPRRDARGSGAYEDDLARYYDLDMLDVTEDIGMYAALASKVGGPILELAAGTGRVAIPLADRGYRVVALDHAPAMLARARSAWGSARTGEQATAGTLELVEADLTLYRSDERFGLIILALNSVMLLHDEAARAAALVTMRSHLREGGIAVIDVVTPSDDEIETYDGRLQLEWVRDDPTTGEVVTKLMSARLDPDGTTVRMTQLFDSALPRGGPVRRIVREDMLHLVTAAGLRRLALRSGFARVELRGDHRLTRHDPGSPRAILIGRLL